MIVANRTTTRTPPASLGPREVACRRVARSGALGPISAGFLSWRPALAAPCRPTRRRTSPGAARAARRTPVPALGHPRTRTPPIIAVVRTPTPNDEATSGADRCQRRGRVAARRWPLAKFSKSRPPTRPVHASLRGTTPRSCRPLRTQQRRFCAIDSGRDYCPPPILTRPRRIASRSRAAWSAWRRPRCCGVSRKFGVTFETSVL